MPRRVLFPPAARGAVSDIITHLTARMRRSSVFKQAEAVAAVEEVTEHHIYYLSGLAPTKSFTDGFRDRNVRAGICRDTVLSRMVSLWQNRG